MKALQMEMRAQTIIFKARAITSPDYVRYVEAGTYYGRMGETILSTTPSQIVQKMGYVWFCGSWLRVHRDEK